MENLVRRRSPRGYYRCAFTGYRPQKMPFGLDESDPRCVDFKARLRETIEGLIGQRYAHFISGGAMGMDTYAAEIVLELKEHGYTNGRLHISHCGNPAAAERLKHMVKAVFDGAKVDISECGGLCSYYAELGGLLVGYEDAEA